MKIKWEPYENASAVDVAHRDTMAEELLKFSRHDTPAYIRSGDTLVLVVWYQGDSHPTFYDCAVRRIGTGKP